MVNFTLNTRGKQLSIHKHGTTVANPATGVLTISHNIGYAPTYMLAQIRERSTWAGAYEYPFSSDSVVEPLSSVFYSAEFNANDIEFIGVQSAISGRFGYVIIKDPAEIAG